MIAINSYYPRNTGFNNKLNKPSSSIKKNFTSPRNNKNCEVSFQGIALSYPIAKVWDMLFQKETRGLLSRISQIDGFLFRGPQTGVSGLKKLKEQGFNVVINFKICSKKQIAKLKAEAKRLGLQYYNIPMNPFRPEKEKIAEVFEIIEGAKKKKLKTYIHCLHGVDRTGMIAALYEMKDLAKNFIEVYAEMLAKGHRKHRWLFPNLGKYLQQEANVGFSY
jgi:protein-tyrosine phosphatase